MKRVTGLGGIFFKGQDNKKLGEWYKTHLGIPVEDWGGCEFKWRDPINPEKEGSTIWSIFKNDSTYFAPSSQNYMVNFRVEDLTQLLEILIQEGVTIVGGPVEEEYGKFAWIMDPDGNKIELWEPKK